MVLMTFIRVRNFKTKFPDFSMIIIHVFPEGFCCKMAVIVMSDGESGLSADILKSTKLLHSDDFFSNSYE